MADHGKLFGVMIIQTSFRISALYVCLLPGFLAAQTWRAATKVKPNTVILHSRADEVVPFAESEELVRKSGLPLESLMEVGWEHRLADE